MAHYAKYTKGSAGSLTRHYERAKNSKGEYIRFKNENIDTSRTYLNYNLAPHQQSQLEFIKERLEDVHCLKRDDVKVMCSWVVTVPKTVPEEHQREFFEKIYKYLEQQYGKKNVVSAYVHMDETTPHMHFAFVPVVYDRKKEREKVSAKECVTRADLKAFHTDLQAEIDQLKEQKGYEFECDILNGATENGNLTVQGLMAKELEEQNEIEMEVLNEIVERSNDVGDVVLDLEREVEGLYEEREKLEKEISTLENRLDSLKGDKLNLLQKFVEMPKIKPIFEMFCKQMKKQKEERMEHYKEQLGISSNGNAKNERERR